MPKPLLLTDGYKFSMAEAGWPLRTETFYYTHRAGGPQVVPLDIAAYVKSLLPEPTPDDYAYLATHGYEMGSGFKAAILRGGALRVDALPEGAIFFPGEPVFSVTGPSALVSWLEPLILQLHFRIQVASLARFEPGKLDGFRATCAAERDLFLDTLAESGRSTVGVAADEDGYVRRVREVAQELVRAVGGAVDRVFEVGLRAASCPEQHALALEACKAEGITRTSSVEGARQLGLLPVGTMGHEHVQRYGSDAAAFRAMHDRRPERPSYLLDTFDTLEKGLPAAFALMREEPERGDSIRFDSGDKAAQLRVAATRAKTQGLNPVYILEDGLDAEATRALEAVRLELGIVGSRLHYGYGGQLVAKPSFSGLTRDRVSAIWKLSQTAATPVMKFGNAASEGKQSIPGRPVVWRRTGGSGPIGIIAQDGEPVPAGYVRLTGAARGSVADPDPRDAHVERSPDTKKLVERLRAQAFGAR